MESSILYFLLLVTSFALCCAGSYQEILRGNIVHLQNGREPNAGVALFPTIPFVQAMHFGIVYGLNLAQENLGWYVITVYFSLAILCLCYMISKLKAEYNKLVFEKANKA
ncbi:MAG TPA: hypothetical protein VIM59_18115 [Cellvibrio sp.]